MKLAVKVFIQKGHKMFTGYKQSLLAYKAMNVERQHRIFVELWSDWIRIAL